MLHKVLADAAGVEMHHEYMINIVQPLGVRRYLGLAGSEEARAVLARTHAAAIRYSEAAHWGDSSNKLSWLIPDLAALLPEAKFVHLVRDGRKVAGSYFRKLFAECYDNRSDRDSAGALRQSAANAGAATGKEILVAGAAQSRSIGQRFPALRSIPAHCLALDGDQPGHPGRSGAAAARAIAVRSSRGPVRLTGRCERLFAFLQLPYEHALCRIFRATAQCEPAGRRTCCRDSRRRNSIASPAT